MAADTTDVYRRLCNALASVFLAHWPQVHDQPVQDLESLFHNTKQTPSTPYGAWFAHRFPKVPAYLRRAATMAAHGAVSSFMTRYRAWQGGDRRCREQKPPRWGGVRSWPVLYAANGGAGAMIRRQGEAVDLKLLDAASGDWIWRSASVARRGKRHKLAGAVPKSPALIAQHGRVALAQPYEIPRPAREKTPNGRVCSVDLGINKQATLSVVRPDGTVTARRVLHLGAHIDRRDGALSAIRHKAKQTCGSGGHLSTGFCAGLYRRARGLNLHIARTLSRLVLGFARAHGARTVVFEDLKHFRPKGGRKRSSLRQKFHGWLHRLVVRQAEMSAQELGMQIGFVHPRGTSSWAYDGSGRVVRDRANHARCRFASGKEYDCDLSAAYNIAARWLARQKPKPAGRNTGWPARGKSAGRKASTTAGPRTPVTLSSLWDQPRTTRSVKPHPTAASAA